MNKRSLKIGVAVTASLGACSAFPAVEHEVNVGVGSEWNDNVYNSSYQRRSDFINQVFLDANLSSVDEVTEYGLSYGVRHESYARDSFDRNNYFDGTGYLNVSLLPNRLSWNNDIASSVTLRDSVEPNTPTNRDQRNSASSGLNYLLVNTNRNQLSASLSASIITFRETTQNDSVRQNAGLAWNHGFTRLFSGGFSCNAGKVEFDTQQSYDSYDCSLTAEKSINGGSIEASLGKSRIEPDQSEAVDGAVYSLSANWQSLPHHLRVTSSRNVSDTTVGMADLDFTGVGSQPIDVNTNVATLTARTRTEVDYRYYASSVMEYSSLLYTDTDDLYKSDLDTIREGFFLSAMRQLAGRSRIRASYQFERSQYAESTSSETLDYVRNVRLDFDKSFSDQFSMRCWVNAENQKSLVAARTFEVYSVGGQLIYTF